MNEEDKTKQPIESTDQATIDADLSAYIEGIMEHTNQTERAKAILPYALGVRAAALCLVDGFQELIASQDEEREQAEQACAFALRSLKANYRQLDIAITGA